jgi:hypothetical protein
MHQKKVISVTNKGTLQNYSLWQIITTTWFMWIREIRWPTATLSAVAHDGTEKLFFHLLDLAILNSYILLSSYAGKKISYRDFRIFHVRNVLAHTGRQEGCIKRPIRNTTTYCH